MIDKNDLFKHIFDNMKQSVIIFKDDGSVLYANDMLLARFKSLITRVSVAETEENGKPARGCCRKSKKHFRYTSSFFTEPLFQDHSQPR